MLRIVGITGILMIFRISRIFRISKIFTSLMGFKDLRISRMVISQNRMREGFYGFYGFKDAEDFEDFNDLKDFTVIYKFSRNEGFKGF